MLDKEAYSMILYRVIRGIGVARGGGPGVPVTPPL